MSDSKPECKYGEKCFRLQADHFSSFRHPHLNTILSQTNSDIRIPSAYSCKIPKDNLLRQLEIVKSFDSPSNSPSSSKAAQPDTGAKKMDPGSLKRNLLNYREYVQKRSKGDILSKIEHSEPYRYFLSAIADESKTHDDMLSVSFPELLSNKLGTLESSLQINFMVQITWLYAQYAVYNEKTTPITLLYGCEDAEMSDAIQKKLLPTLNATYIKPSAFGSHHTKMMILSYTDKSIRVIVTTGNLIEFDWENTTQGIWISPRLPFIEQRTDEEYQFDSETKFKKDLLSYLRAYNLSVLNPWIEKVKNADCREVKVFFIASTPGTHSKKAPVNWGLNRLAELLNQNALVPSENAKDWPLYYQCSSIGSLGKDPHAWLLGEVTRVMSSAKKCLSFQPPVKLIYPSFDDVFSSYDGLAAGGCLPYNQATHDKQPWLNQYLCKWKSNIRNRTKSMPHIKTYCRISPCKKYLSWFLLTSANLSKAAWGMENKAKTDLRILSYEAGVLFIPTFLIEKDRFPLTNEKPSEDGPQFPLHYDIPPTPYTSSDSPWVMDMLQNA
ncbi:probable tyrosyl-DNA phosphodiesterase [Planococcus citri]|uniref:probable tyrosyl-DNA phosphodiesterase n=1 Tax=Planococcus citri TaxID=170843 RepID=UPI0031F9CC23